VTQALDRFRAGLQTRGIDPASLSPAEAALADQCASWLAPVPPPARIGAWSIDRALPGTPREEAFGARHAEDGRAGTLYLARTLAAEGSARAAAGLRHAGLAPLLDSGSTEGRPWRVVDAANAGSLEAALARGALEPRRAAQVALELAETLAFAHGRGVAHGALDAAGVRLDPGQAQILDFGSHHHPHPAPADDLRALGALYYRMLTGREPGARPALPCDLDPGIPIEAEAIAWAALGLHPRRQYVGPAELAGDLRRWLAGAPLGFEPPGRAARVLSRIRRRPVLRGALLGLLCAGVLLGAAAGLAGWGQARDSAARRAAAAAEAVRAATPEAMLALESKLEPLADAAPGDAALRGILRAVRVRRAEALEAAGRVAEARSAWARVRLDDPADASLEARMPPAAGRSSLLFRHPPAGAEAVVFGPRDPATGAYRREDAPRRRQLGDGAFVPLPPGRWLVALLVPGAAARVLDVTVDPGARVELDLSTIRVSAQPSSTCRSIAAAIALARPGMVIEIDEGTYEEELRIDCPNLHLRARAGAHPVIAGIRRSSVIVAEDSPGIRFEGLEVRNGKSMGIRLIRCDHAVVRGCTLSGNGEGGLSAHQSEGLLVEDAIAADNEGVGIALEGCRRATVTGTQARGGRVGIHARDCSEPQLVRNVLWKCAEAGIRLDGATDRPLLYANQAAGGIAGIRIEGSTGARVIGNTCRWQTGTGIALEGSLAEIRDNAVWNERRAEPWGIEASGAAIEVARNLVAGGGRGLRFDAALGTIRGNVFYQVHAQDVVLEGPVGTCDGNLYWPDHLIGSILGNDLGVDLDSWRGLTALANGGRALDANSIAADPCVSQTESGGVRFAPESPCRAGRSEADRLGPAGEEPAGAHYPLDDVLRETLEGE